jgi:hypothetical protein
MPVLMQHILVLMLVVACGLVVFRQGVRTFTFRKGKFGACCAKGCPTEPKPADGRGVFIPSSSLTVTRRP